MHDRDALFDVSHLQQEARIRVVNPLFTFDAWRLQAGKAEIGVQREDRHELSFGHNGEPNFEAFEQESGFQAGTGTVRRVGHGNGRPISPR